MGKSIVFIVVCCGVWCFWPKNAKAQRCLPSQMAMQVSGGLVDGFTLRHGDGRVGFFGGVHFSRYNRNKTRWVAGAEYLEKDYAYGGGVVPMAQFTADAGYYVPVLSDRGRNVILSLGFSAVAGYETTN